MSLTPCPTAPKIAAIVDTMDGDPDVVQFELRIKNPKVLFGVERPLSCQPFRECSFVSVGLSRQASEAFS
jgi:hypothetical protein